MEKLSAFYLDSLLCFACKLQWAYLSYARVNSSHSPFGFSFQQSSKDFLV